MDYSWRGTEIREKIAILALAVYFCELPKNQHE